MPCRLLALADMKGNLVAAGILLLFGVLILRLLRSPTDAPRSRRWLPVIAFCCGPGAGLGWFLVGAFWVDSRSYIQVADYWEQLPAILTIGCFGGAIGAVVFWFAEQLPG